ncbi:MAG: alpha/beta fold hydrolase [Eubacteriales bacterium]|nr:alpha/beta fold hydrolase [Eubacteriales bacterium]
MREIIRKEFLIRSDYDDVDIHVLALYNEADTKAVIQFSHGMCEHKERYLPIMQYLAEQGFACIINDHRGHGESVKGDKDLGYFYTGKEIALVEDIHDITKMLRAHMPGGMKLFLFGHSMGSLIVRAFIMEYDMDIDGLIVCGSPSNNLAAGAGLVLVKMLTKLKGDRHRSNLINKLVFGQNSKGFEDRKNSWLCSDQKIVDAYNNDIRDGFIFTLNGFETLFKLVKKVYCASNYKLQNEKLPIMFIAGADDPVIVDKKKWTESQEFLKKIGYEHISSHLYEGMRHEILNEIKNDKVYADILTFIKYNL